MVTITHQSKADVAHATGSSDAYLQAIKQKIAQDRALGRYYGKHPLDRTDAIIFDTGLKQVLVRRPTDDEKCIIDWINVTVKTDDLARFFKIDTKHEKQRQEQIVNALSKKLLFVLGFGLDGENSSGRNFYDRSFNLEFNTGFIAIGGQRDTVMISINGQGCNYASFDFETRLYDFLTKLKSATITRIDLAHDMLTPLFNIDLFDQIHSKGGFNKGGRNPDIEYRGNWKNPNYKGRTLYIGSRQSSKYCRIYEKGKALGDPDSPWLRIEVEYKSNDIVIPLNILLNPTDYFIATYPCFYIIEESQQERRFDVRDKEELISFDAAIELVKKQYGRYLHSVSYTHLTLPTSDLV